MIINLKKTKSYFTEPGSAPLDIKLGQKTQSNSVPRREKVFDVLLVIIMLSSAALYV